jgi:hypothetical protein
LSTEPSKIEIVSSRLEMTRLLAQMFKQATPGEASILAYLSLGQLNPPYIPMQFNIASKSMIKIVADVIKVSQAEVAKRLKEVGDLGLIVEEGSWRKQGDLS